MNKSVIWDMDGVLIDTGELHFVSWTRTLADFDIPFSKELFTETFGMNNAGILEYLLGAPPAPELIHTISERKEMLFRELIHGAAAPLPGVLEWLKRLQTRGFTQAIASSAPQANIDALVDELNIRGYFNVIVSGFDLPGKPNPAVFLKAAELLATLPEWCVVVEDATAGVAGAKRAGMKCIAVTTTNPAGSLRNADLVVDSLDLLAHDAFDRLLSAG